MAPPSLSWRVYQTSATSLRIWLATARFQGGGNGDVLGGKAAHGCPDAAEFLQCGLAVRAAALVAGELACVPVGGLLEQLIDVGAAGEVAGCAAEQLADVVDRLARIGHSRSPPLP